MSWKSSTSSSETTNGLARLVSRFRSSHHCAAHSFANFGIKGTLAIYDSSAARCLRDACPFRKTGVPFSGTLTRPGHGLAEAFHLLPEHAYEQASVDNLHREGLQRDDDGSPHRCAGAHVEAALVERAFHDAVDHHAVRQIGVLVRTHVLCRVE